MLQRALPEQPEARLELRRAAPGLPDLVDLRGIVRRQSRLIRNVTLAVLVAAAAFAILRPPKYVATASVLIDTKNTDLLAPQGNGTTPDPANVDSQLEILKSDQVAGSVVDELDLAKDPAFNKPGWAEWIGDWTAGLIRSGRPEPATTRKKIIDRLKKVLLVRRVGVTNLLVVDATAPDPVRAADLSNRLVEAYLRNQFAVKQEQVQKVREWLQDRTNQLKMELRDAEKAAEDYRSRPDQARAVRIDLESAAQAVRNAYESYLKRLADSAQLFSYITLDAQLVSRALPPATQQGPGAIIILAGGLIFGLGSGLFLGFAREQLETTLKRPAVVTDLLGVRTVAVFPLVEAPSKHEARKDDVHREENRDPPEPEPEASGLLDLSTRVPGSSFALAARAIQVAIDLEFDSGNCAVLGVVATTPGDGGSTVAANLGFAFSRYASTLLIDANIENSGLRRSLDIPGADPQDAGSGGARGLRCYQLGDLVFAPIAGREAARDMTLADELAAILRAAKDTYRYVVVDLPPLLASPEARAAAPLVDCFVPVVRWGRTTRQQVQYACLEAPEVADKAIAAALTGMPLAALDRDRAIAPRSWGDRARARWTRDAG